MKTLGSQGWINLSGKILAEDRDFITSRINNETKSLAIDIQLDELAVSRQDEETRERIFRYF